MQINTFLGLLVITLSGTLAAHLLSKARAKAAEKKERERGQAAGLEEAHRRLAQAGRDARNARK